MYLIHILALYSIVSTSSASLKDYKHLDICGSHNSRKLYVEYGSSGVLSAEYKNRLELENKYNSSVLQKKCEIEFIRFVNWR